PVWGAGRVPAEAPIAEQRSRLQIRRRFARWRIRVSALVAILAHAIIFTLLLVTLKRKEQPPEEVPPSPVAMVFESGRKEGPSSPNPTLQAKPVRPAPGPPSETPEPTPS